jgi:hypothetical protein
MSYYFAWEPYVSVAEKRRRAEREVAKLKKRGQAIAPVRIEGRKIAKSFWGQSWCTNLERYSDFANRLPRGRAYVRNGSWLRKNVSERSKATSDWLASTLRRADWLFLRLRGLETLLKLPEVILSDLETPRQPAAQARIAARSGFTPTMFITRVRL